MVNALVDQSSIDAFLGEIANQRIRPRGIFGAKFNGKIGNSGSRYTPRPDSTHRNAGKNPPLCVDEIDFPIVTAILVQRVDGDEHVVSRQLIARNQTRVPDLPPCAARRARGIRREVARRVFGAQLVGVCVPMPVSFWSFPFDS